MLDAAVDLVVHPKKSAVKASFPELLAELEHAFAKIQRQSGTEVHR
jgi:RNase P protein component